MTEKKQAGRRNPPTTRARRDDSRRTKERPTRYNKALADEIVGKVCYNTLRTVLKDKKYPDRRTFYAWRKEHPELEEAYNLAVEVRADDAFEEMEEIARDVEMTKEALKKAKLMISTRQWNLAKSLPKRYGTQKVEADVKHSGDLVVEVVNFAETEDGSEA